jgi:hypothetical protein
VSRHTLQLRLKEDGLLSNWDKARQRMTIRRTLGGAVRTVLHISQNSLTGGPLSSEEPSKPSKAPFEEGTASVDREKADEKPSSEKQNRPFGKSTVQKKHKQNQTNTHKMDGLDGFLQGERPPKRTEKRIPPMGENLVDGLDDPLKLKTVQTNMRTVQSHQTGRITKELTGRPQTVRKANYEYRSCQTLG